MVALLETLKCAEHCLIDLPMLKQSPLALSRHQFLGPQSESYSLVSAQLRSSAKRLLRLYTAPCLLQPLSAINARGRSTSARALPVCQLQC